MQHCVCRCKQTYRRNDSYYFQKFVIKVILLIKPPNDIENQTPTECSDNARKSYEEQLDRHGDPERNHAVLNQQSEDVKHDPVFHWVISQIRQVANGFGDIISFNPAAELKKKLQDFLDNEIKPLVDDNPIKDIQEMLENFLKFLESPNVTIGDIFEYVSNNLIAFGLKLSKRLLSAILRILNDLLAFMETMLFGELKIPFIGALFPNMSPAKAIDFSRLNTWFYEL